MTSPWTPERVEKLAAMWEQNVSAEQIGKLLGVSKAAITGKAFRMREHFPRRQAPEPGAGRPAGPVPETRKRKPPAHGNIPKPGRCGGECRMELLPLMDLCGFCAWARSHGPQYFKRRTA